MLHLSSIGPKYATKGRIYLPITTKRKKERKKTTAHHNSGTRKRAVTLEAQRSFQALSFFSNEPNNGITMKYLDMALG
jgi:hypothetical protein